VIACLGDSVTHGVFEVDEPPAGGMVLTYDARQVYHAQLKRLLDLFFPAAAVQVINAGISGDTAAGGAARLERDVLSFAPDLCIVCFGLNDAHAGLGGLPAFQAALAGILDRLADIPTILLTPCMMNRAVPGRVSGQALQEAARRCMAVQNDGILAAYVEAARTEARARRLPVCDEYARYAAWSAGGVATDRLLANGINHPVRDIHGLWAHDLFALLLG
jgi:lysophospholipase L1-like esterase